MTQPPLNLNNLLIFDLETTSTEVQEARIIQIAAMKGNQTFMRYVDTGEEVKPETFHFTGIDPEVYHQEKRPLREVLEVFSRFAGDLVPAGHNLNQYDLPVLRAHYAQLKLPLPTQLAKDGVDSLWWARVVFPTPPTRGEQTLVSYRLGDLHRFFTGQTLMGAHQADMDVWATRVVMEHLLAEEVDPQVIALWQHLELPFSRLFAPVELLKLDGKLHPDLLRRKADVPQVRYMGAPFPAVSEIFPEWPLKVVENGRMDVAGLNESLKDLSAGRHTENTKWLEARFPEAKRTAKFTMKLARSYRMKRQTDGQVRSAQKEMADQVAYGLSGQQHVSVIQAPTGTGKTKGYLYPALAHAVRHPKDRIVLSTHTKVLQHQILEELQGLSDYQVHAVAVKSSRNLLCLDGLYDLLQEKVKNWTMLHRYSLAVLTLFARSRQHELEMLPNHWYMEKSFREIKFQLESYVSRCYDKCPFIQHCALQTDLKQRQNAGIWVTNHAWLLNNLQQIRPTDENSNAHLILDEAHNLEDVATEAFSEVYSEEATRFHLIRLITTGPSGVFFAANVPVGLSELVKSIQQSIAPRVMEVLDRYSAELNRFILDHGEGEPRFGVTVRLTQKHVTLRTWPRLKLQEDEFLTHLNDLITVLHGIPPFNKLGNAVGPTLEYFKELRDLIRERRKMEVGNQLPLMRHEEDRGWTHLNQPIRLHAELSNVWQTAKSVTLTSATLAPGGDFSYLIRTLGLGDAAMTLDLPESLPYEKAHVLIPSHLPDGRQDNQRRFMELYAQELDVLLPSANRSLTLFTSRERMNMMSEKLADLPIMVPMNRRGRDEVARAMQEPGQKMAFGTRAFMEGVDFPDLKVVNLERIPFPVPDDLLLARQDALAEDGFDPWFDLYLKKALLTFQQAFGRLIRDDRNRSGEGAFILWDKRVLSAIYREIVFQCLPESLKNEQHLHRPENRQLFYDQLARILGVSRQDLPVEDLLDETTRQLREIQRGYREKTLLRKDAIRLLLTLFWSVDGTPIDLQEEQKQAIDAALDGKGVLTLLPTGFGKSVTFQLPALLLGGVTVVISPLIALMEDQVEQMRLRGAPVAAINASHSGTEQRSIMHEVMNGEIHLLYVSPERLHRSEELRTRLRDLMANKKIQRLVYDEAHCLSEWGHDFRPDYRQVLSAVRDLGGTFPVTALTATATPRVKDQLIQELGLQDGVRVTHSSDREKLTYYSYLVTGKILKLQKVVQILRWMEENHPEDRVIIYVSTRNAASRLAQALGKLDFKAAAYHAGMSPFARGEVQSQFKDGDLQVMVATNAFGMGVDQRNVRVVIHFSPPRSLAAYIQEAGRAGRDRQPAHAVLLHEREDWKLQNWLMEVSEPSEEDARVLVRGLGHKGSKVTRYALQWTAWLQEQSQDSEAPVAGESLVPMLALLKDSGVVDYQYRVGKVRVLCAWDSSRMARELGALWQHVQADYRPSRTPVDFDWSQLPVKVAEQLNDAFFELGRKFPLEVLYSAHEPAIEVELRSENLEGFREQMKKLRRVKEQDLEMMARYASTPGCKRVMLLNAFEEVPRDRAEDASPCCSNCSEVDEPWGITEKMKVEDLEAVYNVNATVLKYLFSEQQRFERSQGTAYNGKGITKLQMVLRGVRSVVRQNTITLQSWEVNTPFFAVLEFVSEKEIERTVHKLHQEGLLMRSEYMGSFTYTISPAGVEHLDRAARRQSRKRMEA